VVGRDGRGRPVEPVNPSGRALRLATLSWCLLVVNGMAWLDLPTPFLLPQRIAQLITYGALVAAFGCALAANPRPVIRPSAVLGLYTLLAVVAVASSARLEAGTGAFIRCGRLGLFLATLWLLTPFWSHPRRPLLRAHLGMLAAITAGVLAGAVLLPTVAFRGYGADGRLIGVFWPVPPPQVGMYAAILGGIVGVGWMGGRVPGRRAAVVVGVCGLVVLASQTRTALSAALVGGVLAGLSLVGHRVRVRRALGWVLAAAPLLAVAAAVAVPLWFTRGQSAQDLGQLTGRTKVWAALLAEPRDTLDRLIGRGLTDKSFGGLSIDNLWLSVYHDLGLAGLVLVVSILMVVVVRVVSLAPCTRRAIAVFVLGYLAVASITEVGLGDASPYVLHLVVAVSLLEPARRMVTRPLSEPGVVPAWTGVRS
jgi:hypothetical protein